MTNKNNVELIGLCGVYKITCLVNNKIYIGSSSSIGKRFKIHTRTLRNGSHKNPHLQNSWEKYGEDSFIFEVLELCEEKELKVVEQRWMDSTRCYEREVGFNNCKKSDRPEGYKHTEEAKKRMSEIKKKQYEEGLVESNWKYAVRGKHTQETKDKISKANKGENNGMYGRKEDEEHKKRRMKNMLSKPRWNKGLTKESDDRIKKLGHMKGKLPYNAMSCQLLDTNSGEKWTGTSLKDLSKNSPISLPTLNRLRAGTAGKETTKRYKLSINV